MQLTQDSSLPCYSARLLKPFTEILVARDAIPKQMLRWLSGLGPDDRLHVTSVHQLLEAAVTLTGDETLGLQACSQTASGDLGLFDFVLRSADTVQAALESAGRYMRLLNDTLTFTLEVEGDRARVRLDNRVVLPVPAEDFQLCGLISNQAPSWPEGMLETLEVWFCHAPPRDLEPYRSLLGNARMHFHAPHSGFSFPRVYLEAALRTRDPRLHAILCRYADATVTELPEPGSVTERVRRVVSELLSSGELAQRETAQRLGMSSRTLSRRLAEEGTTFRGLVDDARKRIALRALAEERLSIAEIAELSGFYDGPSFFRAFRRWTGLTPRQYRRSHRGSFGAPTNGPRLKLSSESSDGST